METTLIVLALVTGVIEVVIRVIPTVGNYAPIAVVLKVLTAISDFFNRKK